MSKIIHYCWFGGKPLPKLAKKCIKSWKKYLPDYEIMEWNEKTFDINCTQFSKEAYKEKKWGFVADVARIYALKNHGGIYFDTDMMVTKNIDFLLDNNVFIGWENTTHVAVGVLGVKNANDPFINELMHFYETNTFNVDEMYNVAIPVIFTRILKSNYGLTNKSEEIQVLKNDIHIYPYDYFYPYSYDNQSNKFTDNSCMIHYYDASWAPTRERRAIRIIRLVGRQNYDRISRTVIFIKRVVKKLLKLILLPLTLYRRKKYKEYVINEFEENFKKKIATLKNTQYLAIYQDNWLGTKNTTKYIFDNTIGFVEINDYEAKRIADEIINKNYKLLIFSAFELSWEKIITNIKNSNSDIIIKILWHGNNSLLSEHYDWIAFNKIIDLYNKNYIDEIGYVKKSMYEFYKSKGYKCSFVMNYFEIEKPDEYKPQHVSNEYVKIGLYASGDRWVKNFYNQLSAASMVQNSSIDCIPINKKIYEFSNIINANVYGEDKPIDRNKILRRIAKNDINIYVTYTECSPVIPLESLELGVPCITSNNHHYFENTELEKYLIVNENDNIIKIYEKILYCIDNKDKIIELYKSWKQDYIINAKKSVDKFIGCK